MEIQPKIAAAMVKAQKAFGPALKTNTNPAFRTKYADLSACIEAVIDALHANGIFLSQPTHEDASGVTVETVFVHESGEAYSSGKLHVPASKQDPQGFGSALTYARRYSLMAACGIAPEDDDGNAGSRKPEQRQEPARQPSKMSAQALADHKAAIEAASTLDSLKKAGDLASSIAQALGDEDAYTALGLTYTKRKKALTTKELA